MRRVVRGCGSGLFGFRNERHERKGECKRISSHQVLNYVTVGKACGHHVEYRETITFVTFEVPGEHIAFFDVPALHEAEPGELFIDFVEIND